MSSIPYPDIDPYHTIGVSSDASPADIKKSYRKLCLQHHPDKLVNKSDSEKAQSKEFFDKIAFAYSIVGDVKNRKRYDETGSLSLSVSIDDDDFNWKDYFDTVKQNIEITPQAIEQDKKQYQNSSEELDDIIDAFVYYQGNFLNLFEVIPHLEFSINEEERVFAIIEKAINENKVDSDYKKWRKYLQTRDKSRKNYQKKMAKEAKQAEQLKKKLKINRKVENEDDLKALIQKKNNRGFDDMISSLERKYGANKITKDKKKSKKSSAKKKSVYEELDDEAFEKARQKLLKKK
ncbi:hypothetical protein DASC09_017840 [Saccharomycopsis crataegensis]|uniref:J domain-containing protein n=1 Tax=Saccharomycopsis crataegensis TaxID=43959 RepID=A0AAV5QIJ0_9ASCO|nr:hypothetical protein DASC09_017840 [Saccharomycopsis crataegensis]